MNWKTLTGTLVLAFALHSNAATPARDILAEWNFNQVANTNNPAPSTGTGIATPLGGVLATLASGTGSSDPATDPDYAWNIAGFPAQGKNPGTAGAEFRVATTGHNGITVRFDLRPSNTACRRVAARYTVDGTTFLEGAFFELTTGGAFTNGLVLDLSDVPAAADNPKFAVRLVSVPDDSGKYAAVSGNYSAAGTWRLDRVSVSGGPIGAPAEPPPDPETVKPPSIRFVARLSKTLRPGDAPNNTFTDYALNPGERLEITAEFSDPGGRPYRIRTSGGGDLPTGSGWESGTGDATVTGPRTARFVFVPDASHEGRLIEPAVVVASDVATNALVWRVYVPTAAERDLVLMEFLANPPTSPANAAFNPLLRDSPATKPSQYDEYLELVNFGPTPIDLQGWRIRDASGWRHVFPGPVILPSSNAVVLYGGPATGQVPHLEVPAIPVGEGVIGLSLNNDGDAIAFYNADTNLVFRVVYTAEGLAPAAALARSPDRNGPFVSHSTLSTAATSPGRRPDGQPYDAPDSAGNSPPAEIRITAAHSPDGTLVLEWNASRDAVYRVWAASAVEGPYREIEQDLTFETERGHWETPRESTTSERFFRIARLP